MTTHLRTPAQNQRETQPDGAARAFEVSHGKLFRESVTMVAQSEYALRSELEKRHPEWWPVSIVEVGCGN